MKTGSGRCLKWTAALISVAMHGDVYALMAENLMLGNPKALALGHAVTADPPGVMSIHFNPAGLSRLEGRQYELSSVLSKVDIGFKTRSTPQYDAYEAELQSYGLNFSDPYKNATADIEGISVMLPVIGVQGMPTGSVVGAVLGGVSFQPYQSRLTFANAIYAPLVGGYEYDGAGVGKFAAREIGVSRITYFSPSFSYKVNDKFSFGASVGMSYVGFGIDMDARVSHYLYNAAATVTSIAGDLCDADFGFLGSVDFCALQINPFEGVAAIEMEIESYFSPTLSLGILWEPTPWLAFGMTYRKGGNETLDGDVKIVYSDSWAAIYNTLCGSGTLFNPLCSSVGLPDELSVDKRDVSMDLDWPDHWAIGTSVKITPRWKVNFDVKYTETSVWDEFVVRFDDPLPVLNLVGLLTPKIDGERIVVPRGYEDIWSWAIGTEYQLNEQLALRLGYEPRKSAIPDDKLDHIVPIGDSDLYTAGFSYQFSRETVVDVGLGYMVSKQKIPAGTSTNVNVAEGDTLVYNPFGGLDVETRLEAYIFELGIRSKF